MIQKGKISKALFVKKNKLKYSKNHFKNLKKNSCGPLTNTGKIVAVNLARNKYRKTNSNAVVSFCERLNAPHRLQEGTKAPGPFSLWKTSLGIGGLQRSEVLSLLLCRYFVF